MQSSIFDEFMRAIQKFAADYGALGITIVVLVVLLTVERHSTETDQHPHRTGGSAATGHLRFVGSPQQEMMLRGV